MSTMFWFLVHFSIYSLALFFDAAWWIAAMRLTKRKLWRALVSIFMAGQMITFSSLLLGLHWERIPKSVLVAVIVWHYFGFALLLPFAMVRASRWMRRKTGLQRKPPEAAPAGGNSLTRREFIGAYAALAPPLFNVGLTGVALAQIDHFRVRRLTLSMPALPRALDGMTIAHVTDMHVGPWTRGPVLREIVNATNALRADLVLLTGDLINFELSVLPEAIALVKAMEGRYGLWMIEGNHDLFQNRAEFERKVRAARVPFLVNESAVAQVRGYPVQLFGMDWVECNDRQRDQLTAFQMGQLMKQRQPEAFPILLAHHPHAFDAAAAAGLPLTLSGHTHGGQWMFDSQHGIGSVLFRYWSGLYTRGRSQLVVSNGVGNVFPIRVNAPAEIVHLTLRCG